VTRVSLIRARFAENLAGAFEMAVFSPSLFMLGLFSLLDVILERPMEEAVKEVALDEGVREALVHRTGDFHNVLDLIYAYEHANWDDLAVKLVKYNLQLEDVITAFIDALVWYKALLDAIGEDNEETEK
jgi:EAL and modified HD-GYP domain-containing signal transduction protein